MLLLFEFALTVTAGQLALLVRVPAAHSDVLDALADRAQTLIGQRSA